MRHLIATCSDAKYGDFLLDHWLRSLQANVDLHDVDVAVLDYGLTLEQRQTLSERGVVCRPCRRDGHLTNIRYRDLAGLIREREYDQVLTTDGGDVIFQEDIRHLFDENKDKFRGVYEHLTIQLHPGIFGTSDFRPGKVRNMLDFLGDRGAVNGGFLMGPARQFMALWEEFERICHGHGAYGNDQLVVNYFVHKTGFVPLEERYNCVIMTTRLPFRVSESVFVEKHSMRPLAVVHNVGGKSFLRAVKNFGYGPGRNQVRRRWLTAARFYHSMLHIWIRLRRQFQRDSLSARDAAVSVHARSN